MSETTDNNPHPIDLLQLETSVIQRLKTLFRSRDLNTEPLNNFFFLYKLVEVGSTMSY